MKFFKTIALFGVAVDVSGTYEPAEPATRNYPGSSLEVSVNTYHIAGTDVSNLIDSADWYEEVEKQVLDSLRP